MPNGLSYLPHSPVSHLVPIFSLLKQKCRTDIVGKSTHFKKLVKSLNCPTFHILKNRQKTCEDSSKLVKQLHGAPEFVIYKKSPVSRRFMLL